MQDVVDFSSVQGVGTQRTGGTLSGKRRGNGGKDAALCTFRSFQNDPSTSPSQESAKGGAGFWISARSRSAGVAELRQAESDAVEIQKTNPSADCWLGEVLEVRQA